MIAIDLGDRPGRATQLAVRLLERGYITSTGGGRREILVLTPPLIARRIVARRLRGRRRAQPRDARRMTRNASLGSIASAPCGASRQVTELAHSLSLRWKSRSFSANFRPALPGCGPAGSTRSKAWTTSPVCLATHFVWPELRCTPKPKIDCASRPAARPAAHAAYTPCVSQKLTASSPCTLGALRCSRTIERSTSWRSLRCWTTQPRRHSVT